MAESALYRAAKETLVEYFQKTSLNGFGLLYYIRRRKYQRLIWFACIVLGISLAAYVVLYTLITFLDHPTVISLASLNAPIWGHPYPAVAVCSAHRLSRRAVTTYVREELLPRSNKDAKHWLRKMHLLAGYFDQDAVEAEQARQFQEELDALLGQESGSFDPGLFLKRLAPSCEDLLLQCFWARKQVDCGRIFRPLVFAAGNCCVFNHPGVNFNDSTFELLYAADIGIDMGLTLLLNSSTDDNFLEAGSGFTLYIFPANSHPDTASGQVRQCIVGGGEDVRLALSLVTQSATARTHGHSVQRRRCYFADERTEYGPECYSLTECLTRCKVNSMWRICGCIPHYAHSVDSAQIKGAVYCNLAHVDCLQRNRVTLETYRYSSEYSVPFEAQQMLKQSLLCPDCLPLCNYALFNYRKSRSRLSQTRRLLENRHFFINASAPLDSESVTAVRLYFTEPYATEYRKSVLYNWYKILSTIGGVIGICMGCSFISCFEIVYFVAFRLCEKYRYMS